MYFKEDGLSQGGKMPKISRQPKSLILCWSLMLCRRLLEDTKQALKSPLLPFGVVGRPFGAGGLVLPF